MSDHTQELNRLPRRYQRPAPIGVLAYAAAVIRRIAEQRGVAVAALLAQATAAQHAPPSSLPDPGEVLAEAERILERSHPSC